MSKPPLPPLPVAPIRGRYRHYKGADYEVLGLAHHSETQEPLVVYRVLYGAHGLWVRPTAMWHETVSPSLRSHPPLRPPPLNPKLAVDQRTGESRLPPCHHQRFLSGTVFQSFLFMSIRG